MADILALRLLSEPVQLVFYLQICSLMNHETLFKPNKGIIMVVLFQRHDAARGSYLAIWCDPPFSHPPAEMSWTNTEPDGPWTPVTENRRVVVIDGIRISVSIIQPSKSTDYSPEVLLTLFAFTFFFHENETKLLKIKGKQPIFSFVRLEEFRRARKKNRKV